MTITNVWTVVWNVKYISLHYTAI